MEMYDVMAFRKQAEELGLSLANSSSKDHNRVFMLDLNNAGTIYVPGHPEKVLELVKLARTYEKFEEFGEHVAILNLFAKKQELEEESYINWYRPWLANFGRPEDAWIQLGQWLQENESPYEPSS